MIWKIDLTETASRQLAKIDKTNAARITSYLRNRIATLENPRSQGKALVGPLSGLWRYRVGDFRVMCEIQDEVLRVLVVRVGNRKNVYD